MKHVLRTYAKCLLSTLSCARHSARPWGKLTNETDKIPIYMELRFFVGGNWYTSKQICKIYDLLMVASIEEINSVSVCICMCVYNWFKQSRWAALTGKVILEKRKTQRRWASHVNTRQREPSAKALGPAQLDQSEEGWVKRAVLKKWPRAWGQII